MTAPLVEVLKGLTPSPVARSSASARSSRACDMPGADGTVRGSAYDSIMRAEWPAVRDRLQAALRDA